MFRPPGAYHLNPWTPARGQKGKHTDGHAHHLQHGEHANADTESLEPQGRPQREQHSETLPCIPHEPCKLCRLGAMMAWKRLPKIKMLMRKSIKKVLGLLITMSTEKLEQLGMHNSPSSMKASQQIPRPRHKGKRWTKRGTFEVEPLPRSIHHSIMRGAERRLPVRS